MTIDDEITTATEPTKPHLILYQPKGATLEDIARLFERLAGRKPSPEELERARQRLDRK